MRVRKTRSTGSTWEERNANVWESEKCAESQRRLTMELSSLQNTNLAMEDKNLKESVQQQDAVC